MKYLVSHQGVQLEPITAAEIVAKINARELDALDYAFDDAQNDWVLLTDLAEVAALLKKRKPAIPPKPANPTVRTNAPGAPSTTEWFVVKGDSKFGPYTPEQMVGLLQQKIVYPFDFAWHQGLNSWTRVSELGDFQPEQIRKLLDADASAFIKRRFARRVIEAPVLIHDNLKLWRGHARELSSGGLGIRMGKGARLVPGQTLTLHCAAQDGLAAFNATCEVVAVNVRSDDGSLECGLRFVSLSSDAQASINLKVA